MSFNSKSLILLGALKRVALKKVYLNVLPVLIGLWDLRKLKIHTIYIPFLLLVSYQLLMFVFGAVPASSVARIGQFFLLCSFGQWLIENWNKDLRINLYKIALILSAVTLLLELIIGIDYGSRYQIPIPRYFLLVGEPNFSAFIYVMFFGMALKDKAYLIALVFIPFVLLTHSRMGVLGILVVGLLYLLKNRHQVLKLFAHSAFGGFILYPFIIKGADLILNNSQKAYLAAKSSRYYLHLGYLDLFLENPLGVGYFNGVNSIGKVLDSKKEYLTSVLNVNQIEYVQQHNLYIQFISEFGVIGLFSFVWFFVILHRLVIKNPGLIICWIPFLFCLLLLNCSHEVVFFMVIAHIIFESKDSFSVIDLKEKIKRFGKAA